MPPLSYLTGGLGLEEDEEERQIDVGWRRDGWWDELDFGELYLELHDLNIEDEEAVVDFVERVGCLGVRSPDWAGGRKYPYLGLPLAVNFEEVTKTLDDNRNEMATRWKGIHIPGDGYGELGPTETYLEFLWGAELLKDFTTALRISRGEIPLDEADWVSMLWDVHDDDEPWGSDDLEGVLQFLSQGLDDGLKPFSPRLGYTTTPDELGPSLYSGEMTIPLYSLMCLELFNHIVEEAEYKECAKKGCNRLFVHQQGSAVHRKPKTKGVKFCKPEHARAEAQRQYRRRQAKKNKS